MVLAGGPGRSARRFELLRESARADVLRGQRLKLAGDNHADFLRYVERLGRSLAPHARHYHVQNESMIYVLGAYTDETFRIRYLAAHVAAVDRARRGGVPVRGYFHWTAAVLAASVRSTHAFDNECRALIP